MTRESRSQLLQGFSLLELIGVLAVTAILAAILLPFLTHSIDRVLEEKETANLAGFDAALQQSILRYGYISNWANLPDQIAAEMGMEPSSVRVNARRQPRFFLVDPAMQIGTNGGTLPYVQTDRGSVVSSLGSIVAPINPRIMIVTSLGSPLLALSSGPTDQFDTIWNTPAGAIPAASAFASWSGRASDLKIKRINLSGLFIRLILASNNSYGSPRYSVIGGTGYDGATPVSSATAEGYFFKSSVLQLYTGAGALDSKQILLKDCSFVYDQNVWRGNIDADFLVELDLRSIANNFLNTPSNPNAAASTTNVVESMITYLNAYRALASSSFTNAALEELAVSAQADMMSKVQGMYLSPKNTPAEIPCP